MQFDQGLISLVSREGKDLEQREGTKMKKHFSAEETSEIILQPSSASELQDSSEEDTRFEGGSATECSLESSISLSSSDPSSESEEDTEGPAHSEGTEKNGGRSLKSWGKPGCPHRFSDAGP
ncbi:hypothetical protein NQZ68_025742 [Dissostichus eleginoides]|nr:hypothetical protein NQZ68_025742 [Dissostichus eleginoides]